ncbi:unnamed protein product [Lupinus luteus]|uniref:GDSL esterase/lipase n=1 Tax=Lupinus luteus TaxID=3873 RepID=A0AAV1WIX4_LUPLU
MKTYVLLIITSFTLDLFEKVVSSNSSLPYDAIFNFGDSLSDTGNFLATGNKAFLEFKSLPYGETFFKKPAGRFSDGRLSIDFIDCDRYFNRSLFVVGEIGGNDHNYVATATKNVSLLRPMVPLVIEAIAKATTDLIAEGAVELMVPGNLPSGCSAMYLTTFLSKKKEDYDEHGCFKALNEFVIYYNTQLIAALKILRRNNPRARIIYGDFYGAALRFFHAPNHYGMSGETLSACCGGGGPYNVNTSAGCGNVNSKVCPNPSIFANWDGIHLTEAANKVLAQGLIEGPFSKPPLKPPPFKIA